MVSTYVPGKDWMVSISLVLLEKSYSLSLQAVQTDHLHSAISDIGKSIFGSLQKALLVQRIEPLSSRIACSANWSDGASLSTLFAHMDRCCCCCHPEGSVEAPGTVWPDHRPEADIPR